MGEVSSNVSVSIKMAPTVKVVPDKLNIKNGDRGSLRCVVEGNYGSYSIAWKDVNDVLADKVNINQKSCLF